MDLEQLFVDNKEKSSYGRYLTLESIEPLLEKMNTNNQLSVIGKSVLENQFINIKLEKENKNIALVPDGK
jgi:hypothetical protein